MYVLSRLFSRVGAVTKALLGEAIAARIADAQTIGVGTGTTVDAAIAAIVIRLRQEQLQVRFVTTSVQSAAALASAGLTVLDAGVDLPLDWGFDGADELDPNGNAIKGGGAAMLREKLLAVRCKHYILAVDSSKLVSRLGQRCQVPVEVHPSGYAFARSQLLKIGAESVTLRDGKPGKHGPVITEAGNLVFDVLFRMIDQTTERKIKGIVGVVESGIFWGYANECLISSGSAVEAVQVTRSAG